MVKYIKLVKTKPKTTPLFSQLLLSKIPFIFIIGQNFCSTIIMCNTNIGTNGTFFKTHLLLKKIEKKENWKQQMYKMKKKPI